MKSSDWQKIKIDRQIVAIAKVRGAERIYSTDQDVVALAKESQMEIRGVADLPLPPAEDQQLPFDGSAASQAPPAPLSPKRRKPSPSRRKTRTD